MFQSRLVIVGPLLVALAFVAAGAAFCGGSPANAQTPTPTPMSVEVLPNEGVSFSQVDFTWPGATTLNSDTGQADVDIAALQASTEMSSGFINVATYGGLWLVQNLPVFYNFPYPSVSTNFDLNCTVGVNVTSLDAYVEFSSDPVTTFAAGSYRTFSVGDTKYDAQGEEGTVGPGAPAPPTAGVITFQLGGLLTATFQQGHPTLETADNQCLPAAVATSLQWLENNYSINVPHPNVMGLGADGSLVGTLETEMGRTFTNRRIGNATGTGAGLNGKLSYLAKNGLGNLVVKHQGMFGGGNVTVPGPDGKLGTPDDMTSTGMGATVTPAFLISEVQAGEDVELGFLYPKGGGHRVEVLGAGTILGIPWVVHQSDYDQSDDAKGTGRLDFSFLSDTDGDGRLNLAYGKTVPNIHSVFSQSVPPGGVGGITEGSDADASPLEATASGGSSSPPYAVIAGAAAGGALLLAAGGWYARRRRAG